MRPQSFKKNKRETKGDLFLWWNIFCSTCIRKVKARRNDDEDQHEKAQSNYKKSYSTTEIKDEV